jgi:SAM-dependent methyltransferase
VSFSSEWNQRYVESTHLSIWPWSDMVSLVRRYCRTLGPDSKVLELGCGAGANIPFFQSLDVQYYGIDGSEAIVEKLHERFPELSENIVVGDFTNSTSYPRGCAAIVDRASLTCNTTAAIASALQLSWDALEPGGHFISVDLYSVNHSEYRRGQPAEDAYTRCDYHDGQFADTGRVHFSNEQHIRDLFSRFELLSLEEKTLNRVMPAMDYQFASWNLVARKPLA